jgi:hypothetical protein
MNNDKQLALAREATAASLSPPMVFGAAAHA